MTTDTLSLTKESGAGKSYHTGDDIIRVLQLKGTWFEMGQQYGDLGKDGMQMLWDATLQGFFDKGTITEAEALELFGTRVFEASSHRMKQLCRGIADALGWSPEKVMLLCQSGPLGMYEAKLHTFAGCSSILATNGATPHGGTITARNTDWGEAFLKFPLFFTVYNPTDGSNAFAGLNFPGWLWSLGSVNDKGVYVDLHDGSSMGGSVVFADRASCVNSVFDMMAECDSAEAVSCRINSMRNDISWIYGIADKTKGFSFECPTFDSRRRDPDGDTTVVVNTFMDKDWGIHKRETVSNSIRRYNNLTDRTAEAHGHIDADKAMEIFDLTLFNEDGTFRENGGATKPTKIDADLTDHQMVTDLSSLKVWLKIPLKTDWRFIDLNDMFQS